MKKDLLLDHVLDVFVLGEERPHFGVEFLVDDEVVAVVPFAALHGLEGSHHVFPHAFRVSHQVLLVVFPQHVVEILADNLPAPFKLVRRHVRDLNEHGTKEVDALEQFEVDVHVVGHLLRLLLLLLLRSAVVLALWQESLSQQLPGPPGTLYFNQVVMRLLDEAKAKGAKAELHGGSVVENLDLDWHSRQSHILLQMRHQHQVSRLVIAIVDGVVVNVREDGKDPDSIG